MPSIPRIPYTAPFPPPTIFPADARSLSAATSALVDFLTSSSSRPTTSGSLSKTLIITGAGISVASGLADYRGENGTYRLKRQYRPIFYEEFINSHEARKRYWARSFLGWPTMEKARPNKTHFAIGKLAEMGFMRGLITQNVDSLHHLSHPQYLALHSKPTYQTIFESPMPHSHNLEPPIVELHGTLRHLTCLTCHSFLPRHTFQAILSNLNLEWFQFLKNAQQRGAFDSDHTREDGIRTNPDGDVDLPGAPYTEFRYPPCPECLKGGGVEVDKDGAHLPCLVSAAPVSAYEFPSRSRDAVRGKHTKGILKPSVVLFGESVQQDPREKADILVQESERLLIVGSSLATYSAWKLVREAARNGKGIGIINLGGVRGEGELFGDAAFTAPNMSPRLRLDIAAADVLAGAAEVLYGEKLNLGEPVAFGDRTHVRAGGGIGVGG